MNSPHANDPINQADALFQDHMAAGSRMLLRAIEGRIIPPSQLLWGSGIPANQWPVRTERSIAHQQERAEVGFAREEMANLRRVSRDPCSYCGTRADVGCRHRRVA